MPAEKVTIYKAFQTFRGEWRLAKVEATKTKTMYRASRRIPAFNYSVQIRPTDCFLSEVEAIEDWQRHIKEQLEAAEKTVARLSKLVGVSSLPLDTSS